MKKNKIISITLLLMGLFMYVSDVEALTAGNGAGVDTNANTIVNPLFGRDRTDGKNLTGVRLSIVTSDGTSIFSRDYLYFHSYVKDVNNVLPGTCSKLDYTNGRCTYNENNWRSISAQSGYSYDSVTNLDTFFRNKGINTNFSGGVSADKLDIDTVFPNIVVSSKEENIKSAINELINSDIEKYYKLPNGTYDLFLVWEPLALVYYGYAETNGDYYSGMFLGTTYELSMLVSGLPSYMGGSSGYSDVGSYTGRIVGCSVYLDKNNNMGSQVSANIDDSRKGYFSQSSYFGGDIILNWDSSLCPKGVPTSKTQSLATSSTSSSGMGVIWIGEFINPLYPTCDDIYNFYGGKYATGSPYQELYIEKDTSFNFNNFNTYWKSLNQGFTGISLNWFKSNCLCDSDDCPTSTGGYNCTPQYNLASCTSNSPEKTIYYTDSNTDSVPTDEYWNKCVFTDYNNGVANHYENDLHKTSASGNLTYYEQFLGSKYCEVYCVESVDADFDSSTPSVLAGGNFVWGWSTVYTTRTCKTKSINWGSTTQEDSFLYDLNKANQAVADELAQKALYDSYNKNNWKKGSDISSPDSTGTVEPFPCTNTADVTYDANGNIINISLSDDGCQREVTAKGYTGCSFEEDDVDSWPIVDGTQIQSFIATGCQTTEKGSYLCTNYTYKDSESYPFDGLTGTASVDSTVCVASADSLSNPISEANIPEAVKKVEEVLEDMNKCYQFEDSTVLNEDSSATISYRSPDNTYIYSDDMQKSIETTNIPNSCTTTSEQKAFIDCDDSGCKASKSDCGNGHLCNRVNVQNCSSYQETGIANTHFELQSGVYNYVLKTPNNLTLKSIHEKELSTYTSGTLNNNWINIGYSNFPVPYNLSDNSIGELKITYSNLGHKSSASTTTAVDTILGSNEIDQNSTYGTWTCPYTASPDIIREDINLIYREIDLARPFPDIDGSNRNTGENWCNGEDCSWNNNQVQKYILNNRNVTGDDIYTLEPMYTFIMTPSDILNIRRYNKSNAYTSYNGSYGGNSYGFNCIVGTGRGCRSDYLTELMNMMDTANYPGTCKGYRQVYSNETEFEKCRY